MKRRIAAPRGLVVERIEVQDDEFVVFSWEQPRGDVTGLTLAEREVLSRVVRGASNASIARERDTSERTVANQVASLMRKTRSTSRFDLIRRFAHIRDDQTD